MIVFPCAMYQARHMYDSIRKERKIIFDLLDVLHTVTDFSIALNFETARHLASDMSKI